MHMFLSLWNSIQQYLIPHTEENLAEPTKKEHEFIQAEECATVDSHVKAFRWVGNGR